MIWGLLQGLALILALGTFLLGLWIVIPAPVFNLLPLSVGTPEISPWLVVLSFLALGLAFLLPEPKLITMGLAALGLLLSLIPIVQIPATQARFEQRMTAALGADYLEKIPISLREQMRPQPVVWEDCFRGITPNSVRVIKALPFAQISGVTLKMNIYQPLKTGLYPALVVIYGGAWKGGSPDQDEDFSRYLAARGYVIFAIDYRHAPAHRYPAHIEDVRTALAFIQAKGAKYEADLSRMGIMGRSAGAHLAMLAAYSPGALPFKAVVDYYGPVDLERGYYDLPVPDPIDSRRILELFFGGPPTGDLLAAYREASPLNYATRPLPPTLLVYGGRDNLVQQRFGQGLTDRLQENGTTAIFLDIPWADHAFDAVFNGLSNQLALYYTERFLARYL